MAKKKKKQAKPLEIRGGQDKEEVWPAPPPTSSISMSLFRKAKGAIAARL